MTDKIPTPAKRAPGRPRKAAPKAEPLGQVIEASFSRNWPGEPGENAIYELISDELRAQDAKWGVQDHPLQGGQFPNGSRKHWEKLANDWKVINDQREKAGHLGWDGILAEEAFEALAEDDLERAIVELVQVAAVAVQAIISLRRNNPQKAA